VTARSRSLLVVGLSLFALLVACGLPKDGAPRAISPDKVPFSLLGPSSTAPGNEPGGSTVALYFVDGDHLRATSRRLTDTSITGIIEALIAGPAKDDPSNLKSALPTETKVLRADVTNGSFTVVLSKEILSAVGQVQENAFAQLVYTATDVAGVNQVQFRVADDDGSNEAEATPPTDSGLKQGPLTRADYTKIAPV
jgi:spore germination protein GerM